MKQIKKMLYILMLTVATSITVFAQETLISPLNNPAIKSFVKSETSQMIWYMLNDSGRIPIGNVQTQILKEKEKIYMITTVDLKQSPAKWIDSTVVETMNYKPIYHSSYNQQRDMVLNFGEKITGYYFNKQTGTRTQIIEEADKSFFDSNFYPQLIRLLPLKDNYSGTISIFDYNPTSKTGIITATIKSTEGKTINFNGKKKQVWKVQATDEISNNAVTSTYYIDTSTRQILKQEIDLIGRKMLMELVE